MCFLGDGSLLGAFFLRSRGISMPFDADYVDPEFEEVADFVRIRD